MPTQTADPKTTTGRERAKPRPRPRAAERALGEDGHGPWDDDYLIEHLRHQIGCPAEGQRPGEVYEDVDPDTDEKVTFASRVEIIRSLTNPHMNPNRAPKQPGLDESHGVEFSIVRCIECGQQFPTAD